MSKAKPDAVQSALKTLDRQMLDAEASVEAQEQLIAQSLETLGTDGIQTVAAAVFHDASALPAHKEAARRWFAENPGEAKRARFVFDRFDGLARLKRLKEALEAPPAPEEVPLIANGQVQLQQATVQLIFAQPTAHGDFPPELVRQVAQIRNKKPYLFLAFPPKCGGTFIRDVLGKAVGAGLTRPGHSFGGRDVSPYLPTFALQTLSPTGPAAFMTHAHMIAYYANVQTLSLFGIKPVVMKRSIPDMLRSFYDQFQRESYNPDGSVSRTLFCGVYGGTRQPQLSEAEKKDFFIHHQAPWYIQFYASWYGAAREGLLPVHWTSYEVFRQDPQGVITEILRFYGLSSRAHLVPDLLKQAEENKARLRFNKGVPGRGAEFFEPRHIAHLHKLAAGYPEVDFVGEGLLPAL